MQDVLNSSLTNKINDLELPLFLLILEAFPLTRA